MLRVCLFAIPSCRLRWACTRKCATTCCLPWLHMAGPCTSWGNLLVGCVVWPVPAREDKHTLTHKHIVSCFCLFFSQYGASTLNMTSSDQKDPARGTSKIETSWHLLCIQAFVHMYFYWHLCYIYDACIRFFPLISVSISVIHMLCVLQLCSVWFPSIPECDCWGGQLLWL